MNKRFKITKDAFINWLISDADDFEYWSKRFIKELKRDHVLAITTTVIFNERESLPGHLFTKYFDEAELFSGIEDEEIPIQDIELV